MGIAVIISTLIIVEDGKKNNMLNCVSFIECDTPQQIKMLSYDETYNEKQKIVHYKKHNT